MKTKRIVITGGPGSGKTTIIEQLKQQEIPCMLEISRQVTLEAQKEGIEQLFLENSLLFSKKLLAGRLQQFMDGEQCEFPFLFYDRGMPDVTAYMDYVGEEYPQYFHDTCNANRYHAIFLLPPWKEIYTQDNERYESFEEAQKIHDYLLQGYQKFEYQVHEVPVGSIENRIEYLLKKLKYLF